jgi:hypothetical protein
MMRVQVNQVLGLVFCHLLILLLMYLTGKSAISKESFDNLKRELKRTQKKENFIHPYDQYSIQTLYFLKGIDAVLIAFNGTVFKTYTLGHQNLDSRYVRILILVVDALQRYQHSRFQPGRPVFQMVLSFSGFLKTTCADEDVECPISTSLPPIISFSSVYQDKRILPTAKSFPNPEFSSCMYEWKIENDPYCLWIDIDQSLDWEDLKNQIIWRGSDQPMFPSLKNYMFMNTDWMNYEFSESNLNNMNKDSIVSTLLNHFNQLSPRWKAVVLSHKYFTIHRDSEYWINASFVGETNKEFHLRLAQKGLNLNSNQTLSDRALSRYKYHIDLAGGMRNY